LPDQVRHDNYEFRDNTTKFVIAGHDPQSMVQMALDAG